MDVCYNVLLSSSEDIRLLPVFEMINGVAPGRRLSHKAGLGVCRTFAVRSVGGCMCKLFNNLIHVRVCVLFDCYVGGGKMAFGRESDEK